MIRNEIIILSLWPAAIICGFLFLEGGLIDWRWPRLGDVIMLFRYIPRPIIKYYLTDLIHQIQTNGTLMVWSYGSMEFCLINDWCISRRLVAELKARLMFVWGERQMCHVDMSSLCQQLHDCHMSCDSCQTTTSAVRQLWPLLCLCSPFKTLAGAPSSEANLDWEGWLLVSCV